MESFQYETQGTSILFPLSEFHDIAAFTYTIGTLKGHFAASCYPKLCVKQFCVAGVHCLWLFIGRYDIFCDTSHVL